MKFLLTMLGQLGGWLIRLVPIFLAYRAGVKDVQAEELEARNEELLNRPHTDDDTVKLLRDKARQRRKD